MNSWVIVFKLGILSCYFTCYLAHSLPKNDEWTLRVVHTNDMHARFEQTSVHSTKCYSQEVKASKCYGGFARIVTLVRQAKSSTVPTLFLNAGDTYQGSLWYTVHKWKIVAELLNRLKPDAISLGNHEFDDGPAGLVPFINAVKFPIVTANLNLIGEPALAASKLQKSVVLHVAGHKVGIIGFLTPDTASNSYPGNVIFLDEIESIRAEVKKLLAAGVKILIGLGHSGFEKEKQIAAEVDGLDLVIGGHTHTFLYTGNKPNLENPEGLYPTVVTQKSGRKVYVVQAYAYTKYLGNLTVHFDGEGEVKNIYGNPILVDSSVEPAQDILDELEKFRKDVDSKIGSVVGSSRVFLDGDRNHCMGGECNLGNLIVDAMVDYNTKRYIGDSGWTDAAIAIHNSGSVRSSIAKSPKHNITMNDVLEVLPFEDEVNKIDLTGKILIQMLEHNVYHLNINDTTYWRGEFLHFAGLQVVYDLSQPGGSRVKSVLVRCADCDIPIYVALKENKSYKILINNFVSNGGDGFSMLTNIKSDATGVTTDEVLADYLSRHSPVYPSVEWRIKFLHKHADAKF